MEAAEGNLAGAIPELILLAETEPCTLCSLPDLGLAYEAAGRPEEARLAYSHFLETPSINRLRPDAAFLALVKTLLTAAATVSASAPLTSNRDQSGSRGPGSRHLQGRSNSSPWAPRFDGAVTKALTVTHADIASATWGRPYLDEATRGGGTLIPVRRSHVRDPRGLR
jgi:hypothetical protein